MREEYVYSGECEPTICDCGSIHHWAYNLEPCSTCGKEGCYNCQERCEFCDKYVCAGERVKYAGCDVCLSCKKKEEASEKMVARVVMELAA